MANLFRLAAPEKWIQITCCQQHYVPDVRHLRQVETKANAEIEEKKVALRQLVGDSYR